jgi:hypothetical protein
MYIKLPSVNPTHVTKTKSEVMEAWDDDALLNPFEAFLEEGRRQGRQEGLEAGYKEGHELGQVTGLEYGMELGFVRGTVEAVRHELARNRRSSSDAAAAPWLPPSKTERVTKILAELSSLLDEFPGPSEMFHDESSGATEEFRSVEHDDADDDEEAHTQRSHERNAKILLQQIRSKFKLLTVVLGIPHFSLAQVMDEAAESAASTVNDESNAPIQTEW